MHANDEVWRVKWKCLYIHDWKYSRVDVVVIELKILLKCYKDSLDANLGDCVAHSTNIEDFLICLHTTLNSKPNLWSVSRSIMLWTVPINISFRARLWSVLYVDVVVVLVDAMRARQQFGYVHYEKILHGSYQNYQHFPLVYSWIPELYRITFRKIF